MRLIVLPRATEDVDGYAHYIFQHDEAAARRFLNAVSLTYKRVSDFPRIGRPWRTSIGPFQNVRTIQVVRYRNYLVFYHVGPREVTIIRVLLGARDLAAALEQ